MHPKDKAYIQLRSIGMPDAISQADTQNSASSPIAALSDLGKTLKKNQPQPKIFSGPRIGS